MVLLSHSFSGLLAFFRQIGRSVFFVRMFFKINKWRGEFRRKSEKIVPLLLFFQKGISSNLLAFLVQIIMLFSKTRISTHSTIFMQVKKCIEKNIRGHLKLQ
uniref:Uncharacterized protein n=1 Tax=Arundo donax TaxID=35708 RepID=A0A0A9HNU4_ARUDO